MENENLELFKESVRGLIYFIRGRAKYCQDHKEALILIYQSEESKEIKQEMILNLYRILLSECSKNRIEEYAIAAAEIDNVLTS